MSLREILYFIIILIVALIGYVLIAKPGVKRIIQVKDGDRTLISATGNSVDEALRALFDKLYAQVQSLVTPEAIQRRIDQMNSAMSESEKRVSKKTREYCNVILLQSQNKYRRLINEKNRKTEESNRVAEKETIAKSNPSKSIKRSPSPSQSKNPSANQRKIAEQRNLMTPPLRYDILVRDGFRCKICGATAADGVKLHVDHIIPVSKGGKTTPSNLRTLCERCNLGKSNKIELIPVPSSSTFLSHSIEENSTEQLQLPFDEIDSDTPKNWTLDETILQLKAHNIRYVNHLNHEGCFWIELTPQSQELLKDKQIDGKQIYIAQHSKAFAHAPAMFIK